MAYCSRRLLVSLQRATMAFNGSRLLAQYWACASSNDQTK
jgi:hypothetical protein